MSTQMEYEMMSLHFLLRTLELKSLPQDKLSVLRGL